MVYSHDRKSVSDEERRRLLKALGVVGAGSVVTEFTLEDIRPEVAVETAGELANMGASIRSDLSGTLDASTLATGATGMTAAIERLPELEAMGLPETVGTAYEELTAAAWPVNDHLVETGFFASAESNLPPFVADHIEASARQLVGSGALSSVLSSVGFSEAELTTLATLVVNNKDHLAKWKPTDAYPPWKVEEFDPADIAPLHQRATEGSLLWIDGLNWWLWQNRVILTEDLVADGIWDVKVMLGGYYLMTQAARGLAEESFTDEQVAALITAGSAVSIIGQEHLAFDVVRITDEMRAPRGGA